MLAALLTPITDFIPAGQSVPIALTALVIAVIVIGIAKSGFGGGVGILAVPLVAAAVDPAAAIGIMLPILIAGDLVAVYQHRHHRSWHHLRPTLIGGVIGIALGTLALWLFKQTDVLQTALNLTVGGVCIVFVIIQCYRLLGGKVPKIPDNQTAGISAGGLAGVVSTLAHSAGPVMSIYLLEHKLEKNLLVGTLVFFFFLLNCAKLPTFFALNLINPDTLIVSAMVIPLIPIGSLLGIWMHKHIAEKPFTFIMYLGAAAAGLRMIYKGFV